jgi:diacylglycerol O-acyltransferase / wax synthase
MLALDRRGGVPQHLGAVLLLDRTPPGSTEEIRRVIVERIPVVPRLRQRLVPTPFGCGPPIWVDDPAFDPTRHVRVQQCPHPGDEPALLDLAADVMTEPLSRSHPPWAAVVAPGLAGGRLAVVLVLHHVLADGLGGLAILSRLVDGAEAGPVPAFPRPAPRRRELAADAFRSRLHALSRLRAVGREPRRSMAAAGGVLPPRAAPCSLLAPTGPCRRFAAARADLAALRRVAHARGASVNDVLLAALSGAVHTLLAGRGERVDELRIAVMVAARRGASAEVPGNRVAPLLVTVPAAGPAADRLEQIAGVVRAARASAAAQPPIAMVQPLFRLIAGAGLYRRYMNHQRRLHLLVSNVPGPREPVALGGAAVAAAVPLSVGEAGNLTVTVLALSYAGALAVTLIADPDHVPDLDLLVRALQAELDGYARHSDLQALQAPLSDGAQEPATRPGRRRGARRSRARRAAQHRAARRAEDRAGGRSAGAGSEDQQACGHRGLQQVAGCRSPSHLRVDRNVGMAGPPRSEPLEESGTVDCVARDGRRRQTRPHAGSPADRAVGPHQQVGHGPPQSSGGGPAVADAQHDRRRADRADQSLNRVPDVGHLDQLRQE